MGNAVVHSLRSQSALTLAGAASILVAGFIHLVLISERLEEATYLGLMFAANFVGAAVAAFGTYRATGGAGCSAR